MPFLQEQDNGFTLAIQVQPKASKARLAGILGHALKVCVTAPPVDGKANTAIIAFFAKLFHVPKSAITVISGHQGRRKPLAVIGLAAARAREIIGPAGDGRHA